MSNRVVLIAATLVALALVLTAPVRGNCFDCCAYGTCPSGWTCCGCPSECYCCSGSALCRSSGSGYSCSFGLHNFPWLTEQDEQKAKAVATGELSADELERVRLAGWKEAGKNETEAIAAEGSKVDGRLRGALRDEEDQAEVA